MAVIPVAILRLHTINGAPDNNHIMAGRIFYTQAGGQITTTEVNNGNDLAELQTYKHKVNEFKAYCPVLEYLNKKIQLFKGGQLKSYYSEWEKLTSDSEILNTVSGLSIDFVTNHFNINVLSPTHYPFLNNLSLTAKLASYCPKALLPFLGMSQEKSSRMFLFVRRKMDHIE